MHLYRIAREAIYSALQRAVPSRIGVRLAYEQGSVVLTVRDDGARTDEQETGLRRMRRYAEAIGATLNVEAAEPRGTAVRCELAVSNPRPTGA